MSSVLGLKVDIINNWFQRRRVKEKLAQQDKPNINTESIRSDNDVRDADSFKASSSNIINYLKYLIIKSRKYLIYFKLLN